MANLLEMAKDIVAAQASNNPMTTDEVIEALGKVHSALSALEKGETVAAGEGAAEAPSISMRKAFGKDQVTCMICGQSMKTLTRHLKTSHGLKPGEYRKQFGIPRTQALAARSYSESRRQMAIDRGLADKLAQARAKRGRKSK